jgi:hypothetical protein
MAEYIRDRIEKQKSGKSGCTLICGAGVSPVNPNLKPIVANIFIIEASQRRQPASRDAGDHHAKAQRVQFTFPLLSFASLRLCVRPVLSSASFYGFSLVIFVPFVAEILVPDPESR